MEMLYLEAKEKVEEISKRYKNPSIGECMELVLFFNHVEVSFDGFPFVYFRIGSDNES